MQQLTFFSPPRAVVLRLNVVQCYKIAEVATEVSQLTVTEELPADPVDVLGAVVCGRYATVFN